MILDMSKLRWNIFPVKIIPNFMVITEIATYLLNFLNCNNFVNCNDFVTGFIREVLTLRTINNTGFLFPIWNM